MRDEWCQKKGACVATQPGRLCRGCTNIRINADPEIRARRLAAYHARYSDPAERVARAHRLRVASMAEAKTPAGRERRRRMGYDKLPLMFAPDVRARNQSAEVRAAAGRKNSARAVADIPVEYRDMYRQLMKSRGMRKAEALRLIEQQMEADQARYRASGHLQASRR